MKVQNPSPASPTQLLQQLQRYIFQHDNTPLTPEQWQLLSPSIAAYGLERFFYYYANSSLPEALRTPFQTAYQFQAFQALKQEHALKQLKTLFQQHRIRFCPLKGVDLAYRLYPAPALRPMGDIDLLIHPEDCQAARAVLAEAGWQAEYDYAHQHHYSVILKDGIALEIHFRLPRFIAADMLQVWALLLPVDSTEHRLPPELNLLLLFNHAGGHHWQNGRRLLLDTGFLLSRQPVDWPKLTQLAAQFRVFTPELLFAAFPDFYPAEYRPPAGAIAPELAADFRQLVLHGVAFASRPHELLMSQPDRFSPAWWRKRIAGLRPLCTRFRHHIPPGHRGQVFRCYLKDCGIKLKYFWRFLSGSKDPVLRQYLKRQKRIADYLSRH